MALFYLVIYWRSKSGDMLKDQKSFDDRSHSSSLESSYNSSEQLVAYHGDMENHIEQIPLYHPPQTQLHPFLTT